MILNPGRQTVFVEMLEKNKFNYLKGTNFPGLKEKFCSYALFKTNLFHFPRNFYKCFPDYGEKPQKRGKVTLRHS